jgi:quercetin dioxygenase-like cupin family protein
MAQRVAAATEGILNRETPRQPACTVTKRTHFLQQEMPTNTHKKRGERTKKEESLFFRFLRALVSRQRSGNMRNYPPERHRCQTRSFTLREKRMDTSQPQVIDLAALATNAGTNKTAGAVWSLVSTDLNLNLLHFGNGDRVAAHINSEVDVIGLVIAGEGTIALDGRQERLQPGKFFFVPKGARRAIQSRSPDFAYLSCHRRRAGLMPTRASR